jgi:hypothetical protein
MTHTTNLLEMFVMLVATAKKHFEEQALVSGTEQSRQAGWLTRLLGLPAFFVPATSACF